MAHITMTATVEYGGVERSSTFKRLWIGKVEVAVNGRSIAQCLEEMYQQGWHLIRSRAVANPTGIYCEYEFERTGTTTVQAKLGVASADQA